MSRFLKILIPLFIVGGLFFGALVVGVYYRFKAPQAAQEALQSVTLQWWSVFDTEDAIAPLINAYQAARPNVTITYRKLGLAEYETQLLQAQAEDRGPDIVSFQNSWTAKYAPRLFPAPPALQIPVQRIQSGLQEEVITEFVTIPLPTPAQVREAFVDVVAQDAVVNGVVLGLPFAMDTLHMYVNRDLLNQKGIALPPVTWEELQRMVPTLAVRNAQGDITTAAAALGGSNNIPRAFDILSVLMLQSGVAMADEGGTALFAQDRRAQEALQFYTDFAKPQKQVYTWHETLPNALELFTNGNLALFFGYAYQAPIIAARAPRLNVQVAPLPQLASTGPTTTFANYWLQGVSARSRNPQWAWDFVKFAATAEEPLRAYLAAVQKPAALRSVLALQVQDPALRVQATQALTAKTWYHRANPTAAEQAFADMIDLVVREDKRLDEAVNFGAAKVQETYK